MFLSRLQRRTRVWLRQGMGLFGLFCLGQLLMGAAPPKRAQERAPAGSRRVLVLTIDGGIINTAAADYLKMGLEKAKAQKMSLVILELDTPGGSLQATRTMAKLILNSAIPVVVYVSPSGGRAGSAGVFITLAGHIAAMSPGTNIGAAHPVIGSKDPEKAAGKHMAKKIENDTVAFVEAIAKQRKRNAKWAKDAVLKSVSVTADEALRLRVVDLIARDIDHLLQQLHKREVTHKDKKIVLDTRSMRIERMPMNIKQKLVDFLAHPSVFHFLLMLGGLGVVLELYNPGSIFPGVVGIICLFLCFIAMQVLPINYGGLALIGLGLLLLFAEFLTPTFGVLFVGGLLSIIVGSVFLIDSPDPAMRVSLTQILPTALGLGLALGLALVAAMRALRKPPASGQEAMIGQIGLVKHALAPRGSIKFNGEQWTAISKDGAPIEAGQQVRILRVDGLKLEVEAVNKA